MPPKADELQQLPARLALGRRMIREPDRHAWTPGVGGGELQMSLLGVLGVVELDEEGRGGVFIVGDLLINLLDVPVAAQNAVNVLLLNGVRQVLDNDSRLVLLAGIMQRGAVENVGVGSGATALVIGELGELREEVDGSRLGSPFVKVRDKGNAARLQEVGSEVMEGSKHLTSGTKAGA